MWIYPGKGSWRCKMVDFTIGRARDGPKRFLKGFSGVLPADAYGGYNGLVLAQDLGHAGCWSHARRKWVEIETTDPDLMDTTTHLTVLGAARLLPDDVGPLK